MLRLRQRPLEVLMAHAMLLTTALMSELLRSGAAMLLQARRKTTRTAESQISTRTAELLRQLPSAKAMTHSTPHPALWATTAVHLSILWAALR